MPPWELPSTVGTPGRDRQHDVVDEFLGRIDLADPLDRLGQFLKLVEAILGPPRIPLEQLL